MTTSPVARTIPRQSAIRQRACREWRPAVYERASWGKRWKSCRKAGSRRGNGAETRWVALPDERRCQTDECPNFFSQTCLTGTLRHGIGYVSSDVSSENHARTRHGKGTSDPPLDRRPPRPSRFSPPPRVRMATAPSPHPGPPEQLPRHRGAWPPPHRSRAGAASFPRPRPVDSSVGKYGESFTIQNLVATSYFSRYSYFLHAHSAPNCGVEQSGSSSGS